VRATPSPLPPLKVVDRPLSRPPLYLTLFVVGVVLISLGPLLDSILNDLHLSVAQGGLLSVGLSAGVVVGGILLNFMLAPIPVKPMLVGATCLQVVALGAAGLLAHGLWSLFAALFAVGLAVVFLNSIPGMILGSVAKTRASRDMLVLMLFFALGMTAAPLAIGLLLDRGITWREIFVGEAILSAAFAVTLLVAPLTDIPGRENLRARQLRDVAVFNPGLLAGILVAAFLYVGAEFILNVWLSAFETHVLQASATLASLSVTTFWVGSIAGRLLVLRLVQRRPASRFLLACASTMAVFAVGVALSPSITVSLVAAFFAGLGASACYSLICSYSARFPAWHAGVVFSSVVLISGLGRIVFPYAVGAIAQATNFRLAVGLSAVLAAAVGVLALYLYQVGDTEAVEAQIAPAAAVPDVPLDE
jgi:fucose permease